MDREGRWSEQRGSPEFDEGRCWSEWSRLRLVMTDRVRLSLKRACLVYTEVAGGPTESEEHRRGSSEDG